MKHQRLVELTTILHRENCLSVEEAWEFARGISDGNPQLEAVTFRLATQTNSDDDPEEFVATRALMFGPKLKQ